jgi:nitroreductase/NAD-dependent dihydropyrimidine dehydrogenase PreA subunit
MITIDHGICRRDGICSAVCPMGLFDVDGEGFPRFRDGAAQSCIACGHCVAVCPHDAVRHAKLPLADAPLIDPGLTVSAAATTQLLKSRRSIREFREEPVGEGLIRGAIDAARWAPTAVNRQPVHWLVIRTPDEVRRLAGLVVDFLRLAGDLGARYAAIVEQWDRGNDMILRKAPHLVIVHAANDWPWSTVDCTIALTQFELAAVANGIGTCWAGFLMWAAREHPPLREALGIPHGEGVYGALMVGLPRYQYRRSPPRQAARVEWR